MLTLQLADRLGADEPLPVLHPAGVGACDRRGARRARAHPVLGFEPGRQPVSAHIRLGPQEVRLRWRKTARNDVHLKLTMQMRRLDDMERRLVFLTNEIRDADVPASGV